MKTPVKSWILAAARPAAKKPEKAEAPKDDAKPDDAGAPSTVTR